MDVIRLTEGDWQRLRDLRIRSAEAEPDVLGWSLQRERGFQERHWRLRVRGAHWWAATHDGQDVGLVSMIEEPAAPTGERHLMALWVASEHRRAGAGRALVGAVAEDASALGAERLTVWAHDGSPGLSSFLLACGFRRTGERVVTPRDPERAEERWARALVARVPTPRSPASGGRGA